MPSKKWFSGSRLDCYVLQNSVFDDLSKSSDHCGGLLVLKERGACYGTAIFLISLDLGIDYAQHAGEDPLNCVRCSVGIGCAKFSSS